MGVQNFLFFKYSPFIRYINLYIKHRDKKKSIDSRSGVDVRPTERKRFPEPTTKRPKCNYPEKRGRRTKATQSPIHTEQPKWSTE